MTTVTSGQTFVVSAGQSYGLNSSGNPTSILVSSGGTLDVYGSVGTTANGGTENIYAGGTGIDDSDGSYLYIYSGGLEIENPTSNSINGIATVYSGGTISGAAGPNGNDGTLLLSGGTAVDTRGGISEYIYSGGLNISAAGVTSQSVYAGGTSEDDYIGVVQNVYAGGVVINPTFGQNAVQNLLSGSVVSGFSINNVDATQNVSAGATAINISVINGIENVYSRGLISNTIVSGGSLNLNGGASGTFTLSYGTLSIESGYKLSGLLISGHPSILDVLAGGTAIGTALQNANDIYVSSGGVISETSAGGAEGTNIYVSNGGTAYLTTLYYGGDEFIFSGGIDSGAIVNGLGGAGLVVLSGGTAVGDEFLVGLSVVSSGGLAISETVSGAGTFDVYAGGTASSTTILSGCIETVFAGGVMAGQTRISGGLLSLYAGSIGGSVVFGNSATLQMPGSGGVPVGLVLSGFNSTDVIDLYSVPNVSGGTASVISGNVLDVLEGGIHYDFALGTVSSGTFQLNYDGANGTDVILIPEATISSGMTSTISAGQPSSTVTVLSGGTLVVASGGVAVNATVSSGGGLVVLSGGVADPTTISSGGSEVVSSGGTDDGALISGGVQLVYGLVSGAKVYAGIDFDFGSSLGTLISGGIQIVETGGMASSTTAYTGGEEYISAVALALSNTVNGGVQLVFGTESGTLISGGSDYDYGRAVGTVISSGGLQVVQSGATASGTTIRAGGYAVTDGTESGTTLSGGLDFIYGKGLGTLINNGLQITESGGTASGSIVTSGGEEYLASGGIGSSTTINSGAQVVFGTAISTVVNSGGLDFVFGVENAAVVNNGGAQIVEAGVTVSGTVINSGGEEYIASGGSARNVIITSGVEVMFGTDSGTTLSGTIDFDYGFSLNTLVVSGVQVVEGSASASGTTVKSGGEEYTASGGLIRNVAISGGFEVMFGTEIGTLISGGGSDLDYGTASGSILSNGLQIVEAGGSASGTIAYGGGQEYVAAGGTASGTTLSGGFDVVYGTTVSTIAGVNGVERVFAGGVASAATVNSAGYQIISSGGTAIGTHANSGSQEIVASGGLASASIISGGIVELSSGASIGTGAITFATSGGGTLRLDDSLHFGGLVAGFGLPDGIDFADIAYTSGVTSVGFTEAGTNTSGTLTLTSGSHVANITLLGQYVAGNFNIQTDGHGGTLVTDPPVSGSSNALASPH